MGIEYWKIAVECALDEAGLFGAVTSEQMEYLAKRMLDAKDMESESCGYNEANKSVRRINDSEAMGRVINAVESLCSQMDSRNSRIYDVATDGQRDALATLFNLRHHLTRQGVYKP